MAITVNLTKPSSPTFTNTTRASGAELWSTITTSWATEPRTWAATVSLMGNTIRLTSPITNVSKPS